MAETTRRRRFTTSSLNGLQPRLRAYVLSDIESPNLYLYVAPSGTRSWWFRFPWHGKRQTLTLGRFPDTPIALAHERARQARECIEKGIDPRKAGLMRNRGRIKPVAVASSTSADDPHSVDFLVREFLQRFIKPHRKNPDDVQRILEREILATWHGRDARSIKPRDVIDLLDGIVDRGAPVMANRVAALVKQLFKFAIHRQIIEMTPVQLLYPPGGREKPRNRVLSDEELGALLSNMDEIMSRAPRTVATIRIILYTACRRGEIGRAKWSHFKLDDQAPVWRIPPELSKTETEYLIPLVPEVVKVLRELKRAAGRSPWVFANGAEEDSGEPKILTRSLSRHLKALAEKKIKPFTLHDLRRTVRTGLAKLKVAPHIAERVLNHAQPGIVATYDVHAYLDEKREALEMWSAHLAKLLAQS